MRDAAEAQGVQTPALRIPAELVPALVVFALLAAGPILAEAYGGAYLTSLLMRVMILAIAALSLDLLIGHGGLVSFGHAAFVGLGAYVAGIMITEGVIDLLAILAVAVAVAVAVAALTGAVSLRTTGVHFIMITLAFGQMLYFTATSLSAYGGDDGLTLWERADLWGTGLLASDLGLYYAILLTLVLTHAALLKVVGSRFGRVLRAAAQNETRVAALGYDVFRVRLVAYILAAVIAAVAGVLLANQAEFVSPATLSWQRSGDLIIVVVLGGMGSRSGAVLGAAALVLIEEALSSLTHDWRLIFGPMLILLALASRGGLAALATWTIRRG
ncbi:MAG: branched-chain amino acid ABC transporter permease [Pseudomonadota bacterium]